MEKKPRRKELRREEKEAWWQGCQACCLVQRGCNERRRKMNKWKKAFAGVLCMMMVETPAVLQMPAVVYGEEAVQAETAVKDGLVRENGKICCYIEGKRQTGWRNVTATENGKTVTNRYYFAKNGQACAATAAQKTLVKKIGGKYYGFDTQGRMIKNRFCSAKVKKGRKTVTNRYYFGKNGAACTGKTVNGVCEIGLKKVKGKTYGFGADGNMARGIFVKGTKFYAFNKKNGVYDKARSRQLNSAAGYEKDASTIRKLLGSPKKTVKIHGCYAPESVGNEYILHYDNFVLNIFRYNGSGKEIVIGAMAA